MHLNDCVIFDQQREWHEISPNAEELSFFLDVLCWLFNLAINNNKLLLLVSIWNIKCVVSVASVWIEVKTDRPADYDLICVGCAIVMSVSYIFSPLFLHNLIFLFN